MSLFLYRLKCNKGLHELEVDFNVPKPSSNTDVKIDSCKVVNHSDSIIVAHTRQHIYHSHLLTRGTQKNEVAHLSFSFAHRGNLLHT